jgi:hypothetical protein
VEDGEMPDRIIEEHIHTDGGGGSALTALVVVLILIIAILAALYFTRVFGRHETKIDVNINKPGAVLLVRS